MTQSPYWQAKIWGLLHDPILKGLSVGRDFSREGQWQILKCMEGWRSPKQSSGETIYSGEWLKYIGLCDLIASASDRSTIGRIPAQYSAINYNKEGIEINHLLSGKTQNIKCKNWHSQLQEKNRREFLENQEIEPLELIKEWEDPQKVYWWLWRCYPEIIGKKDPITHLLPAETRFPDASLWSHVSMTSALAGGLAGYYPNKEDYPLKNQKFTRSRPYITTYSFSPVQELIKASRKMRDFWAGSWLLHYLSAKIAWAIASKYGPDTLLYPCLYQQPLIDHWLIQKYPDFKQWLTEPSEKLRLTAGFPNVLVMILPNNGTDEETIKGNPVRAAMEYANKTLKEEWSLLGNEVLNLLQKRSNKWKQINLNTWENWLKSQWQNYWVSLPLGNPEVDKLSKSPRQKQEYKEWVEKQNEYTNPNPYLFEDSEQEFIEAIFNLTQPQETEAETISKYKFKQPNLNVGSWWASTFDQVRYSLNAVKNARNWLLPTAFGPRSTISGLGAVANPVMDAQKPEWVTEGDSKNFWKQQVGLFDGIEELNATEVVKRGLHQVLGGLLATDGNLKNTKIPVLYPDLSSGVAGWLKELEKNQQSDIIEHYHQATEAITKEFPWTKSGQEAAATLPWGIPWIAKNHQNWLNPRLLNAGWLIEDYESNSLENRQQELTKLRQKISEFYTTGSNPTDWYILAAGDGDGMGEWLKGIKLKPYSDYIPEELKEKISKMPLQFRQPMEEFLKVKKRMGPATHSALSRALLDFSNQLVPYLTEERYAGRLIYGGGDDVLAYTNLWEWDNWLWDLRQCFCGQEDPQLEFKNNGDYWQWKNEHLLPENLVNRPLFTMGSEATISFGITIAHHSVPLAIALENLWEAEEKAKEHYYLEKGEKKEKDAVQIRVIYGNGNILKATAKFEVFNSWQQLINNTLDLESGIFEIAVEYINKYPIPEENAILYWVKAFCERRVKLSAEIQPKFEKQLTKFIQELWQHNNRNTFNQEISNWLKLAAFMIRSRKIK